MAVSASAQGRVFFAAPITSFETAVMAIDFTQALVLSGESFVTAGVAVEIFQRGVPGTDLTGTMLVPGSAIAIGNIAQCQVYNGVDTEDFVAQFKVTTNLGRVIQAQIIYPVRDRPYEATGVQTVSVEEILNDLGLNESSYLYAENLLNAACTRIESLCNTFFALRGPGYVLSLDGPPFPLLDLGCLPVGEYPNYGITAVAVGGNAIDVSNLDPNTGSPTLTILQKRGQIYRVGGWMVYSPMAWTPFIGGFGWGPFLPQNVQVTGTFGYDPIPPDVVDATMKLVRYWDSLRGREGMLEERFDVVAYRTNKRVFGGAGQVDYQDTTGIPDEVFALLQPYVRHGT
jgi:hypothetical protein